MAESGREIPVADRFEVRPIGYLAHVMERDGLTFQTDMLAMRAMFRTLGMAHTGGVRAALFFEDDMSDVAATYQHPVVRDEPPPLDIKVPLPSIATDVIAERLMSVLAEKQAQEVAHRRRANSERSLLAGWIGVLLGTATITLPHMPNGANYEQLSIWGASIAAGSAVAAWLLVWWNKHILEAADVAIRLPDVANIPPPIQVITERPPA